MAFYWLLSGIDFLVALTFSVFFVASFDGLLGCCLHSDLCDGLLDTFRYKWRNHTPMMVNRQREGFEIWTHNRVAVEWTYCLWLTEQASRTLSCSSEEFKFMPPPKKQKNARDHCRDISCNVGNNPRDHLLIEETRKPDLGGELLDQGCRWDLFLSGVCFLNVRSS